VLNPTYHFSATEVFLAHTGALQVRLLLLLLLSRTITLLLTVQSTVLSQVDEYPIASIIS